MHILILPPQQIFTKANANIFCTKSSDCRSSRRTFLTQKLKLNSKSFIAQLLEKSPYRTSPLSPKLLHFFFDAVKDRPEVIYWRGLLFPCACQMNLLPPGKVRARSAKDPIRDFHSVGKFAVLGKTRAIIDRDSIWST